jgi:DNA ligase D-like protein (predicted ligase)
MSDPLGRVDPAKLRPLGAVGFQQPMLATLTDRRFSDPDWIFERKLDGVRALVVRDGGRPQLFSRNNKNMDRAYPELVEALDRQPETRFVADGEIVAFDGRQTSFSRLQGRIHLTDPAKARATGIAVFLYLFDLLGYSSVDLRQQDLRARKSVLRAGFDFADPIRYSTHRNSDGEEFFKHACASGWEGLIAKRANSTYQNGRSKDWLKLKCAYGQEFVVGGFTDPQGSRSEFGALLLGHFANGEFRYAGKVGTGFDQRTLRDLRRRLEPLTRDSSPFSESIDDKVAVRTVHWVKPELVVDVAFSEWTGDGRLRHPRYVGLRLDKPAREVVRESGSAS